VADRPAFSHRRERHGLVGPFSGRQLALAFTTILVAVIVLVGVTTPLGNTSDRPGAVDPRPTAYLIASPPPIGLKVGQQAPEFAATKADGSVWVNFFTTWCPPCQAEVPILRDVSERYRDRGLELVAISIQETSPEDVAAYAARYQLDYTIGFDGSGDIFRAYKAYGLPTQLFVDENGVIASIVGAPLDEAGAVAEIERILPTSGPAASPSPSPSPSR
jgi:thiol-disulfide isomerase/thioredoxin